MRGVVMLLLLVGCEGPRGEGSARASVSASASASASAVSSTSTSTSTIGGDACRDLTAPIAGAPKEQPLGLRNDARVQGVHVTTRAPWRSLRELGFRFAYAGAAHGAKANEAFADNWRAMKACALPRGAFHFVVPSRSGGEQARVFLDRLDGDFGELPPAIDLETPPGCKSTCCEQPCGVWKALARSWLEAVRAATAREPLVYTVEPFWIECLCGAPDFAAQKLWLGAWPKFDFPAKLRFGGWPRWTFYHWAGNRRFRGGVVDLDLFAGDADALAALLGEPKR